YTFCALLRKNHIGLFTAYRICMRTDFYAKVCILLKKNNKCSIECILCFLGKQRAGKLIINICKQQRSLRNSADVNVNRDIARPCFTHCAQRNYFIKVTFLTSRYTVLLIG